MQNQFSRLALMFGADNIKKLTTSHIAVFGLGGVGGNAAEALARGGIGALDLFDNDTICLSNINRQLFATHKTVGMLKVDAAELRLKQINPDIKIVKHNLFYSPQSSALIDLSKYDYIIDAIDTVSAKIELVIQAAKAGTKIISCMGAGNKLDPTAFEVADIYKTSVCPLAKVMRSELKKRGVKSLKVVYSKEPPLLVKEEDLKADSQILTPPPRKQIPSSNSFVPPVAGLILAGEVIKDLLKILN